MLYCKYANNPIRISRVVLCVSVERERERGGGGGGKWKEKQREREEEGGAWNSGRVFFGRWEVKNDVTIMRVMMRLITAVLCTPSSPFFHLSHLLFSSRLVPFTLILNPNCPSLPSLSATPYPFLCLTCCPCTPSSLSPAHPTVRISLPLSLSLSL